MNMPQHLVSQSQRSLKHWESGGLDSEKSEVKRWYDGFIFGEYKDIYNPWSILNYLDSQQYTNILGKIQAQTVWWQN